MGLVGGVSLGQLVEKIGEDIGPLMGKGPSDQEHDPTSCLMGRDKGFQLGPASFADLGRTDRTTPNTGAGLKALVMRSLVLVGLPDLDSLVLLTPAQAFSRSGVREKVADDGLEGEALQATFRGIPDRKTGRPDRGNFPGFRVNRRDNTRLETRVVACGLKFSSSTKGSPGI